MQIDSIQHFGTEVGELDQSSLVLFDIDYTLIVPKDAVLGPKGKIFSHSLIEEILEKPAVAGKYSDGFLYGKVLTTASFAPVEEQSVTLIRELQRNGIPVLALTAAEARKIGEIDNFADFRIAQLKGFGFDFSTTYPTMEFLQFSKSPSKEYPPVYKSGILFSSDHPKGEVLKQFLAELKLSPKKIVFIDDGLKHVESVELAAQELGMDFVGFHYTAADKLSPPLDKQLGEFQVRHLAEHGEWLGDEKAKKLIECLPQT